MQAARQAVVASKSVALRQVVPGQGDLAIAPGSLDQGQAEQVTLGVRSAEPPGVWMRRIMLHSMRASYSADFHVTTQEQPAAAYRLQQFVGHFISVRC